MPLTAWNEKAAAAWNFPSYNAESWKTLMILNSTAFSFCLLPLQIQNLFTQDFTLPLGEAMILLNSSTSSPPSPWAAPALPAPRHEPNHVIQRLKSDTSCSFQTIPSEISHNYTPWYPPRKYLANLSSCNAHSPSRCLPSSRIFPQIPLHISGSQPAAEKSVGTNSPQSLWGVTPSGKRWEKGEKPQLMTHLREELCCWSCGEKSPLFISISIPCGRQDLIPRESCFPWVSLLFTAQLSVHQL